MAFAALYSLMLLTALIGVWRSVGRKEKMVEKLQESAQVSYRVGSWDDQCPTVVYLQVT